ncbi:hypothetical protein ACHAW6_005742 [Cyclotella cf. meneghiniana]
MDNTDINTLLLCSATILPGCANPPNLNTTTLIDTVSNITSLATSAPSDQATLQLQPKSVMQPQGDRLMMTETLLLLFNKLPPMAREAHLAPGISHDLVSAATLADAGCKLFFHKTGCEISLHEEIILQGGNKVIPPDHNVAQLALAQHSPQVNSIYECKNTSQLINFYCATMSSPVISMWIKAIDRGYLRGWRGLTSDHIRSFIKPSEQSEQGHMDQRHAGIPSTKSSSAYPLPDTMEEPEQAQHNDKTNMVS